MRRIGAPGESMFARRRSEFAIRRPDAEPCRPPQRGPARRLFPSPFWPVKKGTSFRSKPEGRLYGTNLRADQGRRPLDGTGKDTYSDSHSTPQRVTCEMGWIGNLCFRLHASVYSHTHNGDGWRMRHTY